MGSLRDRGKGGCLCFPYRPEEGLRMGTGNNFEHYMSLLTLETAVGKTISTQGLRNQLIMGPSTVLSSLAKSLLSFHGTVGVQSLQYS